jgi:UDP-N-acetylglucosamine--N-acetylmuramyl-(pentapeptide) pyrophosphoryl-undecaprenol N-acetylglucosamine transferase
MSVLLVCSGGGHLKQLNELLPRMPFPTEDRLWVTFDTGLSRSLMAGEEVLYARYAAPRDTVNILRNAALAAKVVKGRRFDHAVSTGSSLAVDFLPLAAMRGASCHFIETAARAVGPSMTGKIMVRTPGVHVYTQYRRWAGGSWGFAGSVFDVFEPAPQPAAVDTVRHAVVTLGTTESYGFRRLLDKLVPLLDGVEVLWQTGATDTSGLGIDAREAVPHDELRKAISEADVVVSHSGTGAAISTLEHGLCPILVPRLMRYHEHVDDHQVQIAAELAGRGLAVACPVADLSPEVLLQAARRRTRPVADPPPLRLH